MQVQEIMTKDVLTVRPQTTVREVAELLVSHKISGLPVVDDVGKLVGIISEGDLMSKEILPEPPAELCRAAEQVPPQQKARVRQIDLSVPLPHQQAQLHQSGHHIGDGGLGAVQCLCDIRRPDIRLYLSQLIDHQQIPQVRFP